MKRSEWISIIGIVIGLFVTVVSSTAILFFKIGGVSEKVTTLEKNFEKFDGRMEKIEGRIEKVEERIEKVELRIEKLEVRIDKLDDQVDGINTKVDMLYRDHFGMNMPIKHVPIDKKALDKTKVGTFVKEHYKEILEQVKAVKPDNSRQAESALISVVIDFGKNHDQAHKLNVAAFESGYDLDSLLIMASMTIRARIISDLSL